MKTWGAWAKGVTIVGCTLAIGVLLFFMPHQSAGEHASQAKARWAFASTRGTSSVVKAHKERKAIETIGRLPLTFEENRGQTAREVRYLSHGSGYELFLTAQEAVITLNRPIPFDLSPRHRFETMLALRKARQTPQASQTAAVRLRFEGANPSSQISGAEEMPGRVNYFIGNDPEKWHTDVPTFARVKYGEIYPGVDLSFYGNGGRLEYDFTVKPGADPKAIRICVQGVRKLRINPSGDAALSVSGGEVTLQKPSIYQMVNGERKEIAGSYALASGRELIFSVPAYDRSEPLILDPVLNYSTYLGGSADDDGSAIAVDASNNVILAGSSTSADFPTTSNALIPQPLAANPTSAAFVTELDPTGTKLLYSTYLAGSTPFEFAYGVSVDSSGKIYVTGTTVSTDFPTSSTNPNFKAGFKVSPNPTNVNGTSFIVKLDPAATTGQNSLLYSSYIGGTDGTPIIGDIGQSIAVDNSGVAYVTGYTDSTPGASVSDLTGFPVVGGFQSTLGSANGNAFLSKIDTTQSGASSLLYSTYFGGTAVNFNSAVDFIADIGDGVAIDSNNNAYVAGVTYSTDLTFTANAMQGTYPANNTTSTAFVARLATTQTGANSLGYLSYLGGTGPDYADAIALGPNNVAYVTGQTKSLNFPTSTGAFSTTGSAAAVAYVTLVNTNAAVGAPPVYSTFLGGSGGDDGFGIRVDANGNAYVAGGTKSTNFPVTPGALQPALATNAVGAGFISQVNPAGKGSADLVYSSYFGGTGSTKGFDELAGIALDTSNNVYVTGQTYSATAFPVFPNPGAFQTVLNGTSDAFVAKLTLIPTVAVVPTSLGFGTQTVGVASAPQSVTLTNNTTTAIAFANTDVAFSGGNATDFSSPSNTCGTSIAAGASCSIGVSFTPSTAAAESATLAITLTITNGGVTGSQTFNVSLTGTGANPAPAVGLVPTSLTFGVQTVNTTSAAQPVTLTNTGTAALTISSISISGDFAQTNTCPVSPATLAAGANCAMKVTFTPTTTGARTGTLTLTDNASGSPQTVPLSGTGTVTPDFSLTGPATPPTVKAGNSVSFTLTVTSAGGFNSAVALACTGAPTFSTCTPKPASVTPPANGTITSTFTVTTTSMMVPPPRTPIPPVSVRQIVPLVLALMLLFLLPTAQRLRTRLAMATAMIILVTVAGCSGPKPPGTPTGPATLTITGTSGALSHSTTVNLTVTP